MKSLTGALTAIAILAGAGVAFAASTTGVIKSIDTKAMTFTLDNGAVYTAAKNTALSKLKAGEKVTVVYEVKNGKNIATAIKGL